MAYALRAPATAYARCQPEARRIMTPYEVTQFIIQSVTAAALLLTLYVYYRQMRTMAAQLQASREGATAQNILALTNLLQVEEVRVAREVVRVRLADGLHLTVVFTDRAGARSGITRRIISARQSNRRERNLYDQAVKQN